MILGQDPYHGPRQAHGKYSVTFAVRDEKNQQYFFYLLENVLCIEKIKKVVFVHILVKN